MISLLYLVCTGGLYTTIEDVKKHSRSRKYYSVRMIIIDLFINMVTSMFKKSKQVINDLKAPFEELSPK